MITFPLAPERSARLLTIAMKMVEARALTNRMLGDIEGHPFYGNQYTGGTGSKTFYHGTAEARLKSILKTGLTRAHVGQTWSGTKSGKVFMTSSRASAETWAQHAANQLTMNGVIAAPAVVELEIPDDVRLTLDDAVETSGEDFEFGGDIPPAWIKGAWSRQGPMTWDKRTPWLKVASSTFYAGFVVLEEPKALGDKPGHAFHGNQWTSHSVGSVDDLTALGFSKTVAGKILASLKNDAEKVLYVGVGHRSPAGKIISYEATTDRKAIADYEDSLALRSLGGKGSGNFGHSGRPGAVGGSSDTGGVEERTVDEQGVTHVGDFVEVYHGTSRGRANKIAKEGVRLRAVKQQTMQGDPEGNRNYVWLAKRRDSAKSYSEMHANPVVVTLRIPATMFNHRNSGPDSIWIDQAIPAKYVHSVTAFKDLGDVPGHEFHGNQWTGGTGIAPIPTGIAAALAQADGGFTYHAVTGEQPKTGYALSLHQEREQILDAKDVNVVALAAYVAKNKAILTQPNNYLGAWHNPADGKVYLDVSTVLKTPEEAHQRGREARQYAYFDLAHGKSVKIEGRRYDTPHGHKAAARHTTLAAFDRASRWGSHLGRYYRAGATVDGPRADARRDRAGAGHSQRSLGDSPGHPFHGNQWTEGSGSPREPFVPTGNVARDFDAADGAEDIALLINHYAKPLKTQGDTVPGVFVTNDHVVEWDEGDDYVSVSEKEDWVNNADPTQFYPDYEDKLNEEFWSGGGEVYHASPDENLEEIEKHGIEARSTTRGISNRSTGAAVYTTTEVEETELGSYGDTVFAIDLAAMKQAGYTPYTSQEPDIVEGELRGALAAAVGLHDYHYDVEQGMSPYTVAIHGNIPAKYLRRVSGPRAASVRIIRTLVGTESSGNYGHAGRPGEVGGSAPSGSTPGEPTSTPKLAAEATAGIAAVERLLPQALKDAEYTAGGGSIKEWDDVSGDKQTAVYQKFYDDQLEQGGVDIDDSVIIDDFTSDLRRDPQAIIEETSQKTLDELRSAFPHTDANLPLGEGETPFHAESHLDPDTMVYGDDDGDGAKLELDELRFMSGEPLTAEQQALVEKTWNDAYEETFDKAVSDYTETDAYYEQRDQLERDAIEREWNEKSDEEKLVYAETTSVELGDGRDREGPVPGPPDTWVTGIVEGSKEDENYARTRAIARELTYLRTNEILRERGLIDAKWDTGGMDQSEIDRIWGKWKGSSSNPESLALQLAIAQEFGGVHRMDPRQEAQAREFAKYYGAGRSSEDDRVQGMARLQAYARAQWETTQFLMEKSGEQQANVYRAVMLEGDALDVIKTETVNDNGFRDYTRFPDLQLKRAGAQSTTGTAQVANDWNGVGVTNIRNPTRVVMRLQVPRTSVLSLPVYGENDQSEHEVVVMGTKDRWRWDAWLRKAPQFQSVALKAAARRKAQKKKAETKPLVIDLQQIDDGQPHWMSKVRPEVVRANARRVKTLGGQGSGNFGHAGRPGEVGGSATGTGATPADIWARRYPPPTAEPVDAPFRKTLGDLGYKAITVDSLPESWRTGLKLSAATAPLSPSALEGVKQGIADVAKASPVLNERLKKNVEILYASAEGGATAAFVTDATATQFKEGLFLVNGAENVREAVEIETAAQTNFTIGQQIARETTSTPDDYQRELYRGVAIHELGHMADRITGSGLSDALVNTLLSKMPQRAIPTFLEQISPYANRGGPLEATAEVFTAIVKGRPLPSELDDYVREVKKLLASNS